ncbi:TIGR03943 family protein [Agreia sp. COWG]|uniref:TIGR03943 family putative permease subunit n=1 Tax=Agreia sp. COWG TaxID=2773266 RepID=UPI001AF7383E|nr:TIGR03943 family protein [Agreia sp. COWG]CAD6011199.1 conserved membrane protein of unknown function [Agreia sp. COWG]
MLERLVSRWQGVALSLIGIVFITWLAITGQLGLYIHPRYFVFTVVMAVVGGLLTLAAFAIAPEDDDHDEPRRRWGPLASGGAIAAIALAFCALVIIPPSTLTSATVENRDLNSSVTQGDDALTSSVDLAGTDVRTLTLKDWATLLRDGSGSDFAAGKTASLSGFVTADSSDPENVFYLTRFVITCCAVDAQPVGVPVYSPGWKAKFPVETWVEAEGTFALNPSALSLESTVIANPSITAIDQPAEPYAY